MALTSAPSSVSVALPLTVSTSAFAGRGSGHDVAADAVDGQFMDATPLTCTLAATDSASRSARRHHHHQIGGARPFRRPSHCSWDSAPRCYLAVNSSPVQLLHALARGRSPWIFVALPAAHLDAALDVADVHAAVEAGAIARRLGQRGRSVAASSRESGWIRMGGLPQVTARWVRRPGVGAAQLVQGGSARRGRWRGGSAALWSSACSAGA